MDCPSARSTIRIAGLVLRRVAPARLAEALQELRSRGMNVAYENAIAVAPDDRILLVFAYRPFTSDAQRLEANAILADLLDSDDPLPVYHETDGEHGCYSVVGFLRI